MAEGSGLRYEDKVTIVTGGSKGIGLGVVQVFVKNGSKVVFCARNVDESEGKAVEKELNGLGIGEATFIACDVTKESEIKNLIDKTVEKYGRIDCLVNNAGSHPPHMPIDDFSSDDFRELLNLNLVSYFIACKYALPHLRKVEGNIINMSSLVGSIGQYGAVTYVATKGGITSFTKALAVDEAKYNVRVNSVSPGNVWTPLWNSGASKTTNPEQTIANGADSQLLGRFGTIEESGQMCLFLASEGTFCTGIDLLLSGGAELNYGIKTMKGEKQLPF
ncbi:hypothetical protein LOTGIDRAFT_208963 [Lottia gigantea]|uniref:17-beta-hydroxysteroid dehydrogenase 14 n=1 Tax=Lottia gigantea TaxID=225164 RepID=V4C7V8_LOTGI|nr:hypothetical protein LOTGIDRAFT_208963 [Lottia gigantea]ESO97804.1 hypothetical protein LOTGIDRAFT_208963 [Lottia gigantea]